MAVTGFSSPVGKSHDKSRQHWFEGLTCMRRTLLLAVPLLVLGVVAPASAQVRGTPINAASQELTRQAIAAFAEGKTTDALDLLETAVAADPRNGAAYVAMGRAYEKLGLSGKALRTYRQALTINPNDVAALEAQAMGFLAKGMAPQARANATRLQRLCNSGCNGVVARLNSAIAQNAAKTSANMTRATARPGAAPARPAQRAPAPAPRAPAQKPR
jgi:tetratricopeptide (TPR) repeat protein